MLRSSPRQKSGVLPVGGAFLRALGFRFAVGLGKLVNMLGREGDGEIHQEYPGRGTAECLVSRRIALFSFLLAHDYRYLYKMITVWLKISGNMPQVKYQ